MGKNLLGKTILYKNDLKSNPKKFISNSIFMPLKKSRTGGTTGSPLTFYQDIFSSRQKERAYIFDIWKEIGYTPFKYRIIIRGETPKGGISYNWFENALIISQNYLFTIP